MVKPATVTVTYLCLHRQWSFTANQFRTYKTSINGLRVDLDSVLHGVAQEA